MHDRRNSRQSQKVMPFLYGGLSALMFSCGFLMLRAFTEIRVRTVSVVIVLLASAILPALVSMIRQRIVSGDRLSQFSLSGLVSLVAVAGLFAGLVRLDFESNQGNGDERAVLQRDFLDTIGQGTGNVATETLIQVRRPSFNDADLAQVMRLLNRLNELGGRVTILDLSGTGVTDDALKLIVNVNSLQFCFLDRTQVTNTAIDAIGWELPQLQAVSFKSTAVTDQRLLQLSLARPRLMIEPKTYQRLLPSDN